MIFGSGFEAYGSYDERGNWQRHKFCFIDCGDRCNCKPPNGMWYSEAHDKSKQKANEAHDAGVSKDQLE